MIKSSHPMAVLLQAASFHGILLLGLMQFIPTGLHASILRCQSDSDCPPEGACFKDECSRCLCPAGMQVVDIFRDNALMKTCRIHQTVSPKVGESCDRFCPYGSFCDNTKTCICNAGLVRHFDGLYCRQPHYGEPCDAEHTCQDGYGFACNFSKGLCDCEASHRRPNNWSQWIMTRWRYSEFMYSPLDCIIRAIGEPCASDEECSAVGGSGSVCGPCSFCQCRVEGHVPDILGTKCGPGLGLGMECVAHTERVCDGSLGLQCGDVCSVVYENDRDPKRCTCSQMHTREGDICIPKTVGSPCTTDLDCYPVESGFGYCSDGTCKSRETGGITHVPYLASRKCNPARFGDATTSLARNSYNATTSATTNMAPTSSASATSSINTSTLMSTTTKENITRTTSQEEITDALRRDSVEGTALSDLEIENSTAIYVGTPRSEKSLQNSYGHRTFPSTCIVMALVYKLFLP